MVGMLDMDDVGGLGAFRNGFSISGSFTGWMDRSGLGKGGLGGMVPQPLVEMWGRFTVGTLFGGSFLAVIQVGPTGFSAGKVVLSFTFLSLMFVGWVSQRNFWIGIAYHIMSLIFSTFIDILSVYLFVFG